jgi:hypothetical protein
MPATVTDASLTTARRRQLTLFSWRQGDQYPQNPQTQKGEQAPSMGWRSTGPSDAVHVAAFVGAQLVGQKVQPTNGECGCSTAVTLQGYVKQSPGC